MNIQYILILPAILLISQETFTMNIERVNLDDAIIARLKPVAKPQSFYGDTQPNIDVMQQPKRHFIAKMDSFGLVRYFTIKNNQDVEALTKSARAGAGWDPEIFYYDADANNPVVTVRQIAPNIVVLTDDQEDSNDNNANNNNEDSE